MNFQYREATIEDIPNLVPMINEAYRVENSAVRWKSESDLLDGQRTDAEALHNQIENPNTKFIIMETDESKETHRLIGCVQIENMGPFAYMGTITIRLHKQNNGLAKKLILYAEEYIRKHWQLKDVKMTVIGQRSELISYYGRLGYHPTGQKESFPITDRRFGKPRRADLYFEVLVKKLS